MNITNIRSKIEKLQLPNLNESEECFLKSYTNKIISFEEITDLFEIFIYNLTSMRQYYQIYGNDKIKPNLNLLNGQNDYILINALVNNYISAGKTLVESIETYMKVNIGINEPITKLFIQNCLNNTYDSFFEYRFIYHLRNLYQHGHLAIGIEDNKMYFDLNAIALALNFTQNPPLEQELLNIIDEIATVYEDYPRITVTKILSQFNICVLNICRDFINTIERDFKNSYKDFTTLLKQRPDIIQKSENSLNDIIIYKTSKEDYFFIESNQNFTSYFQYFKKRIKQVLNDETKIHNKVK